MLHNQNCCKGRFARVASLIASAVVLQSAVSVVDAKMVTSLAINQGGHPQKPATSYAKLNDIQKKYYSGPVASFPNRTTPFYVDSCGQKTLLDFSQVEEGHVPVHVCVREGFNPTFRKLFPKFIQKAAYSLKDGTLNGPLTAYNVTAQPLDVWLSLGCARIRMQADESSRVFHSIENSLKKQNHFKRDPARGDVEFFLCVHPSGPAEGSFKSHKMKETSGEHRQPIQLDGEDMRNRVIAVPSFSHP